MISRLRASVQDVVRGAQSAQEAEERILANIPEVSHALAEKRHDHFDIHVRANGRGIDIYVS